jgi:hypothetical protein
VQEIFLVCSLLNSVQRTLTLFPLSALTRYLLLHSPTPETNERPHLGNVFLLSSRSKISLFARKIAPGERSSIRYRVLPFDLSSSCASLSCPEPGLPARSSFARSTCFECKAHSLYATLRCVYRCEWSPSQLMQSVSRSNVARAVLSGTSACQ